MTPSAAAAQGVRVQAAPPGRRRSAASRVLRVTLAVTEYERVCMREIAARQGILRRVATRTGPKVQENGTGSQVLRTMSLEQVVAEYERLQAAGEIKE